MQSGIHPYLVVIDQPWEKKKTIKKQKTKTRSYELRTRHCISQHSPYKVRASRCNLLMVRWRYSKFRSRLSETSRHCYCIDGFASDLPLMFDLITYSDSKVNGI